MAVEAELHDGTVLEFPDGTSPDIIQRTVRKQLQVAEFRPPSAEEVAVAEKPVRMVTSRAGQVSLAPDVPTSQPPISQFTAREAEGPIEGTIRGAGRWLGDVASEMGRNQRRNLELPLRWAGRITGNDILPAEKPEANQSVMGDIPVPKNLPPARATAEPLSPNTTPIATFPSHSTDPRAIFENLKDVVPTVARRAYEGARQGAAGNVQSFAEAIGADDLAARAKEMGQSASRKQAQIEMQHPTMPQFVPRAVSSGAQSVPQTLTSMGIGAVTPGGVAAKLTASLLPFYLGAQGTSYDELRASGFSPEQARYYSAVQGGAEAGTEVIPMRALLDVLKAPQGRMLKQALNYMWKEGGTEEVNTIINHAVDLATTRPDLTPSQMAQELLDTAGSIAVTGLATGGGAAAVAHGAAAARALEPKGRTLGRALLEDVAGAQPNPAITQFHARNALSPENAQMHAIAPPPAGKAWAYNPPPGAPNNPHAGDLTKVMSDSRSLEEIRAEEVQKGIQQAKEEADRAREAKRKEDELAALQRESRLPAALFDAEQIAGMERATGRGDFEAVPNAMQAALERARQKVQGTGERATPIKPTEPEHLDIAGQQVDQNATTSQLKAGNYQKAHLQLHGLGITIETPKGATRTAIDGSWSVSNYPTHYGYVKGTRAKDGEQVDVHVGDTLNSPHVYLIDQINPDGTYDEAKAMIGFPHKKAAAQAYEAGFSDGKGASRIGAITQMSIQQFKQWLNTGKTRQPFRYVQPTKEAKNATQTGQEQAGHRPELSRVPPRADVPEHGGEVRKGEGGQADGGSGAVERATAPQPEAATQEAGGGSVSTGAVHREALPPLTPAVAKPPPPAPAKQVGPVLQNRNRSSKSSIVQMNDIAGNPDPSRLSFSRDFLSGAPTVIAGGADIPEGQMGKRDRVVTASGREVPVRYAVVEAATLLPSHSVDGSPSEGYAEGATGKLRVIAGNGRAAGIHAAFERGTTGKYVKGIADDASLHGVTPEAIQALKQPVLVRVMPDAEVTENIGDETNTAATAELSPAEKAANDARRIDVAGIEFGEDGEITRAALRQFVTALPDTERSGLVDQNGEPTRQAYDRLTNAVFMQAYGDTDLVSLQSQATDQEARAVMSALVRAAPVMARLENAGGLDIRSVVIEAAKAAVNAKRAGVSLAKYAAQSDITLHPDSAVVLQFFADNIRSASKIGDGLIRAATTAAEQAGLPATDMFGAVPRLSREDVLGKLKNETSQQEVVAEQAGAVAPGQNAGRPTAGTPGQAGNQPAEEARPALELAPQTNAEIAADEQAKREAKAKEEAAGKAAEAKAKAETERKAIEQRSAAVAGDFNLTATEAVDKKTQQKTDAKAAEQQLAGQGDIFSAPAQTAATQIAGALRTAADTIEGAAKPVQPNAEAKPQAIADFGEKIGGARKDYAQAYKERMAEAADMDIAAEPLSKSWPEPDYQKLLDGGTDPWAVAFMHAARDEVPTKPQRSWKLKTWVDQVTLLRDFTMGLAEGRMDVPYVRGVLEKNGFLKDVASRTELYTEVGHDKSLKGIRISEGQYGVFDGVKHDPPKVIWTVEGKVKNTAWSRWPTTYASGDTRAQAIENFKQKWAAPEAQQAEKAVEFGIYSRRGTNTFFIGKKIGKEVITLKDGFTTAKEARQWKADNQAELVKLVERYKEIPNERRESNSPRVGEDHRNGANVTPVQFKDTFGFRGGQFGNTMPQGERQSNLNEAYDALMDLAGVLDIPPKALSLNGELGLAFGARGTGGRNAPSAHYERDTGGKVTDDRVVINLTRERGAGSLAHEWFHAVDNYFARMRGEKSGMITLRPHGAGGSIRPEMLEAFNRIVASMRQGGLLKRSQKLDTTRSKPYWATTHEMAARSFESYIVAKLEDQGASNDYLANIVSQAYWDAKAALGMEKEGTFPYPAAAEIPAIRAAFDDFFKTVETKETDKGVAMYEPAAPAYGGIAELKNGVYDTNDENKVSASKRKGGDEGAPTPQRDLFSESEVSRKESPQPALVVGTIQRGVMHLGFDRLDTPEKAANAFAALRKAPFEKFQIIITDAADKPIAAWHLFSGTLTQTSVYPREVLTAAYMTPGAKKIWFAHNHPSGVSAPSRADEMLTHTIAEGLGKDLGIEFAGHISIAGRKAHAFDNVNENKADRSGYMPGYTFDVPPASRKFAVPIMERTIKRQKFGGTRSLNAPTAVRDYFREIRPAEPGLLLMDAQNRVLGFWPISIADMGKLRTGDVDTGAGRVIQMVGKLNPGAAIAYIPGVNNDQTEKAVQNIGSLLSRLDVRLLDAFVIEEGETKDRPNQIVSYAERGIGTSAPTFFSRAGEVMQVAGLSAPEFRSALSAEFGDHVAGRLLDTGIITPISDQSKLPEHVVPFVREGDTVYGFYDPKTDKTYAVLSNLNRKMIRGFTLHEVGTHYGFERMLGQKKYELVLKRLDAMYKTGNALVREARARATAESVNEAQIPEETLAYLVQHQPKLGIVRAVISAIKAFLYREFGIGANSLTTDDLNALARAAVEHSVAEPVMNRGQRQHGELAADYSRTQAIRKLGFPAEAGQPIASDVRPDRLRDHPQYEAAKSGDALAAAVVVRDFVKPANLEAARERFGSDVIYIPPVAQEQTGVNALPAALAMHYASSTGASVAPGLVQTNHARHTGAKAMERLIVRPVFDGSVAPGARYVLVDDVSTMGATLAEMANHIRQEGGEVAGAVLLVNASRTATMAASKAQTQLIEARYGNLLRTEFGIEPGALTAAEAGYVSGFRDADSLRNRAATARTERAARLAAKGISEGQAGIEPPPAFSRAPLGGAGKFSVSLQDLASTQRTFNWLHKTIGSQPHKAKVSPEFGAVYANVSDYIADSTYISMQAHAKSPTVLPLIEKVRELGKMPPATADMENVMDALAAGTLYGKGSPLQGRRWLKQDLQTAKDTRNQGLPINFKPMTDEQIKLYNETLDSVGVVVDELAKSVIFRLQRNEIGLAREAFDGVAVDDIAQIVRDEATSKRDDAVMRRDLAQQNKDDAGVATAQKEIDNLEKLLDKKDPADPTGKKMIDGAVTKAEKSATGLKDHGYFPLMRFGPYAVIVKNEKGITVERLHYDFETLRNRDFRRLTDLYAKSNPDYTLAKAVLPQKSHQMFQGMSPDVAELFADQIEVPSIDANGNVTMQPLSQDASLQAYIKDVVSARSAMKRHIHRKGIPGFERDAARVLSSFIESGGRLAASNYHMGEAVDAWGRIPDTMGDVKDEATELMRFIQDPNAGGSKLGALAFNMFLGGDFGQFVINRTQPVTAGLPWLIQYTSAADAMEKLFARAPTDQAYRLALKRAKDTGLAAPQELHQLRAYTRAGIIAPMLPPHLRQFPLKFSVLWGAFMSISEQANREQMFKAGWMIAKENPLLGDPYKFAERAIKDTQVEYGRAAIPNLARNPFVKPAFVFKQFTISMVEMAIRLMQHNPKAAAMMFFILFLVAGLEGEPFAENLEDIMDALGQWAGWNTNTRKQLRDIVTNASYSLLQDMMDPAKAQKMANSITEGIFRGPLSVVTGIDFSGRYGMGRLIPGTQMLPPSHKVEAKDILGIYGPPGSVAASWLDAMKALYQGKTSQALKTAAPRSVQNVEQGVEMLRTGKYTDRSGRKVADVTKSEAAFKILGLHPESIGAGSRARSQVMESMDIRSNKQQEIVQAWAHGILDKDPDQVKKARQSLIDWNKKNPEARIDLKMSSAAPGVPQAVIERVREARKTADQRLLKSAPKVTRPFVRKQLQGHEGYPQ